jgi:hypothetical protein
MTALIVAGLLKFWPIIAGVLGLLGWGIAQRRSGARNERARQAQRDVKAAAERHEMDREATDIERKVRDLSDEQAKAEALRWKKR